VNTTLQKSSDPRVADLVEAGQLRFGLFPPQLARDVRTGTCIGPWFEVARALAAHLGVPLAVVELSNPAEVAAALATGACDVASLGFDPSRVDQVGGFTPAFMRVDYTHLVPPRSPIRDSAGADQPGLRIAAVRNHASTLALGRILKSATMIEAETPDAAFGLLSRGEADVWASIRPVLVDFCTRLPGSRVLEQSYGANLPALVVAKGKQARLDYLREFVEAAKASGAVQQALDRAGQPGYALP
jgi:polar amino acid transport system substrate-binding protein